MSKIEFLQDEKVLWQGSPALFYERTVIKYIGLICTIPILFMMLIYAFTSSSPIVLVPLIIVEFGANFLIFFIIRLYLRSYTERLKEPPEFYLTNKRIMSNDPDNANKKYFPDIPNGITIKKTLIIMDIDNLSKVKFFKFRHTWNVFFYVEKRKNAPWWIKFDSIYSVDKIKEILINFFNFQYTLKKKAKEIYSKE
jgi:hypothetical protein